MVSKQEPVVVLRPVTALDERLDAEVNVAYATLATIDSRGGLTGAVEDGLERKRLDLESSLPREAWREANSIANAVVDVMERIRFWTDAYKMFATDTTEENGHRRNGQNPANAATQCLWGHPDVA
jgi:hypothetical protein